MWGSNSGVFLFQHSSFQMLRQKWLLGGAGSPVGAPAAAKGGQVARWGQAAVGRALG